MTSRFAIRCKGLLLGSLLCLSTWALALPSPKDIEASVQAGQLDRAESQLREVLREKPSSARAQYELGQVLAREGRYLEAEQALRQAQKLEPSLKFAHSPQQFNELLVKLETKTRAPSASASALHTSAVPAPNPLQRQAPAPSAPVLPWGWLLLGGGALTALVIWMRRAATAQRMPAAPTASPFGMSGHGQNGNVPASYSGPYPGVPAGQSATGSGMGSTVTGAVVGGIAGLAAGYALTKMLETDHGGASSSHAAVDSPGIHDSPFEPARGSQPDFGTFDAGNGAGWDNADSSSSSDSGADNW
jgi:hypothetical protein